MHNASVYLNMGFMSEYLPMTLPSPTHTMSSMGSAIHSVTIISLSPRDHLDGVLRLHSITLSIDLMSCTNKFSVPDTVQSTFLFNSSSLFRGMAATGKEPSPSWQSALALQRDKVLGEMVLSDLRYSIQRIV